MRRLLIPAQIVLGAIIIWQLLANMPTSAGGRGRLSPPDLAAIAQAPSQQTYVASGQTTFRHQGKSLTLRIKVLHEKPDKHRIEYLTAPLKGVLTVDNGKEAWRFDPKLRTATTLDGCRSGDPGRRIELILRNHVVQRAGSERIAGRSAYVVLVQSKESRAKKRLWVDSSTHIILRSEDYSASGEVSAATRFDSIEYVRDIPESMFERPSDTRDMTCFSGAGKPMGRELLGREVGFEVKTAQYVPAGYRLEGYRLYECPCGCGHKSAYVRYTNGLESISIFQFPEKSGCATEGQCAMSAKCVVHDQTAVRSVKGLSYVVIGDLKPDELRKVTQSLR